MCPENEEIQLKQVANEAVEGIVYIKKKSEFSNALKNMRDFLIENKCYLLSHSPSLRVKLYFYARPSLPMIKPARIVRDYLRKVINTFLLR